MALPPDIRIADISVGIAAPQRDIAVIIESVEGAVVAKPLAPTPVITAVFDPVDISVTIEKTQELQVQVQPPDSPVVTVAATEIPVVASAVVGPQGPAGPRGLQGPPGPPGASGGTFTYTQVAPSDTWVIDHPLNKFASVMVVDSGNTVIEPDISYNSTTRITVTFGSQTSGKAYLN